MYHYIVDQTRIPTRNFDRLLGEVYGHLTEHQISGEVHRVTRLRNVPELVETVLSSGAKTVVAIGDDQNFLQLVELLAAEQSMVLGYIPLIKNSVIAQVLGLSSIGEACQAIARRVIEEFDLGLMDRNYFFTKIDFGLLNQLTSPASTLGFFRSFNIVSRLRVLQPLPLRVRVDGKYNLAANIIAGSIINTRPLLGESSDASPFLPSDGKLDLLLLEKLSTRDLIKFRQPISQGRFEQVPGSTILHAESFELEGPKILNLHLESLTLARSTATIKIAPNKLRVIVGKNRKF